MLLPSKTASRSRSTSTADADRSHMTDHRLEIGRVNKVHGLRGEVVVALSSNVDERLAAGATLYTDATSLTIERSRRHQEKWLVQFVGVSTREAAEALGRPTLYGDPLDDPDALWIHELIGAAVVDSAGVDRGHVVEVHDNPASDLLVLSTGAIVPLTFVTGFDAGVVTVAVPEGLFELYEES